MQDKVLCHSLQRTSLVYRIEIPRMWLASKLWSPPWSPLHFRHRDFDIPHSRYLRTQRQEVWRLSQYYSIPLVDSFLSLLVLSFLHKYHSRSSIVSSFISSSIIISCQSISSRLLFQPSLKRISSVRFIFFHSLSFPTHPVVTLSDLFFVLSSCLPLQFHWC